MSAVCTHSARAQILHVMHYDPYAFAEPAGFAGARHVSLCCIHLRFVALLWQRQVADADCDRPSDLDMHLPRTVTRAM
jgi:hypothetical protein